MDKWGTDVTKHLDTIHVDNARYNTYYFGKDYSEQMRVKRVDCNLADLPTTLSREIAVALFEKDNKGKKK